MNAIKQYLSPIDRLGIRKYSSLFPIFLTLSVSIISELFAYMIAHNPNIVGIYIVFINVGLIIYFSFRDGIKGGVLSTFITVLYYFYIIYTRDYSGVKLSEAVDTTVILFILYTLLATIIGWLKQTIDILLEREKEARLLAEDGQVRLQTILQQLPLGIILFDVKTNNVRGNKQLEKILGRKVNPSLQSNPKYKSRYAYRDGKSISQADWPIVRAIKKGEVVSAEEIEFITDTKEHRYLRVNAAPIINKQKQIIAAVSTIDDITQEKALENRKDDFINMASHELKTPLTSMKLYIDLLLGTVEKYQDARMNKILIGIKSQTEKLQELVSDLLDVSRIQTGKLSLSQELFHLDALIEETITIVKGTDKKHEIIFRDKKELTVHADRFRIYQVLTNLLTNAIKYSPRGTRIIVSAKPYKNKVLVSVQDFGIGIAKEQQSKIFERLYQVTDPHEKTFPGLGMGLYISKEIIQRHKGKIWVESEKGKGSTFYFLL